MTQQERVLRHLQEFGCITPVTAVREYGIYRLAVAISDLRHKGWQIRTVMQEAKNRYGEVVRYARYELVF